MFSSSGIPNIQVYIWLVAAALENSEIIPSLQKVLLDSDARSITFHHQILEIAPKQPMFFSGFHWRPQAMTSTLHPRRHYYVAILRQPAMGQIWNQIGGIFSKGLSVCLSAHPAVFIVPVMPGEAACQSVIPESTAQIAWFLPRCQEWVGEGIEMGEWWSLDLGRDLSFCLPQPLVKARDFNQGWVVSSWWPRPRWGHRGWIPCGAESVVLPQTASFPHALEKSEANSTTNSQANWDQTAPPCEAESRHYVRPRLSLHSDYRFPSTVVTGN